MPSDETMESGGRFSDTTLMSSRFRESTRFIPSPGALGKPPKPYTPLILRLIVVVAIPLDMIAIGIALEVALFISNHNNGFKVPINNVFNIFGNVSAQFLASFIPSLLILPIAYTWREIDWNIRWYQPYIVLQKGNAPAEESLLLDYIQLGPFLSIFRAMMYKHRIVFWSSLTAILTYGFQPLSGSIFQIRQAIQTDNSWSVTSTKSIGLATEGISDLSAFVAAAGYTDASAIIDTIGDPPFVHNGWATAEVAFPANPFSNGTLTVTTSGIQTNANCSNPVQTTSTISGTNLIINATSVNGCTMVTQIDPSDSTGQYGVVSAPCPQNSTSTDVGLLPVAFWFYNQNSTTPQSQVIFCTPLIQAMEVQAVASLNNGSLETVNGIGPFIEDNNVFSPPQNGSAFNGVVFNTTGANAFVQAAATAVQFTVPGAIFKAAIRSPQGLQGTFDLDNGFLFVTQIYYTRHLSVVAQLVYFVDQNTTLSASVNTLVPRLVIDGFPAHVLAILLIITGLIGLPINIRHRSHRKKLLLATPPGSIGSIVALTARPGFGELLLPYDDSSALEKKLDGLRFRLDRRTGAIVADDIYHGDSLGSGPDDAMLSLMGGKLDPPDSAGESSSFLAQQAALGTLPFERSWAPSTERLPKSPLSRTEYIP